MPLLPWVIKILARERVKEPRTIFQKFVFRWIRCVLLFVQRKNTSTYLGKKVRTNHNDLKIVRNVTRGPFIASLFKKLLHQPSSHFPFPFFGFTKAQKVGRPLPAVWMQSTEICMRTEGDHPSPLCAFFLPSFFLFFSFSFLFLPPTAATDYWIFSWVELCHIPDCCAASTSLYT